MTDPADTVTGRHDSRALTSLLIALSVISCLGLSLGMANSIDRSSLRWTPRPAWSC